MIYFKTTLILFSAMILFGCKQKNNPKPSSKNTKVFVVDEDFCKEMKMPDINFSIEYSNEFEIEPAVKGEENFVYNSFYHRDKNSIITEEIAFCYYVPDNSKMKDAASKYMLVQSFGPAGDGEIWDVTHFEVGKFHFDGKTYMMAKVKEKIKAPEDGEEYVGEYLCLTVLIEPQGNNKNGLAVTFRANDRSEIKSYEDFARKGLVSKVWQSIKFD